MGSFDLFYDKHVFIVVVVVCILSGPEFGIDVGAVGLLQCSNFGQPPTNLDQGKCRAGGGVDGRDARGYQRCTYHC